MIVICPSVRLLSLTFWSSSLKLRGHLEPNFARITFTRSSKNSIHCVLTKHMATMDNSCYRLAETTSPHDLLVVINNVCEFLYKHSSFLLGCHGYFYFLIGWNIKKKTYLKLNFYISNSFVWKKIQKDCHCYT